MENRILEAKELINKRDRKDDPLDREALSNALPEYIHVGVENMKMQVGERKQWVVVTGIMRAGLKSGDVKDEIKEVRKEYED